MTYSMELLGIVPRLEESIPDGERAGLVSSEVVEVETSSGQGVLDVVDDRSLDRLDIISKISAHELPHLLSTLLVLIVLELRLVVAERNSVTGGIA